MQTRLSLRLFQAKQGTDCRQQLFTRNRFSQITVGGFQSADAIFRVGESGGNMQYRNVGSSRIGFQAAAHLEAIEVGKPYVQSNKIRALSGQAKRLRAIARFDNFVSASLQRAS